MTDQPTIADVLDRAADLITPEGAWTQGTWARNASGRCETLWSDSATCFCIRGAIVRIGGFSMSASLAPFRAVLKFSTDSAMARWNDKEGRTQPEVVAKLREAAALAREQGK